jgi:hypothetical protein
MTDIPSIRRRNISNHDEQKRTEGRRSSTQQAKEAREPDSAKGEDVRKPACIYYISTQSTAFFSHQIYLLMSLTQVSARIRPTSAVEMRVLRPNRSARAPYGIASTIPMNMMVNNEEHISRTPILHPQYQQNHPHPGQKKSERKDLPGII